MPLTRMHFHRPLQPLCWPLMTWLGWAYTKTHGSSSHISLKHSRYHCMNKAALAECCSTMAKCVKSGGAHLGLKFGSTNLAKSPDLLRLECHNSKKDTNNSAHLTVLAEHWGQCLSPCVSQVCVCYCHVAAVAKVRIFLLWF